MKEQQNKRWWQKLPHWQGIKKEERRNPSSSMLQHQLARVKVPVSGSSAGKSLLWACPCAVWIWGSGHGQQEQRCWLRGDRGSWEASTPPETTRGARDLPWHGPVASSMSALLLKAQDMFELNDCSGLGKLQTYLEKLEVKWKLQFSATNLKQRSNFSSFQILWVPRLMIQELLIIFSVYENKQVSVR